ncbi:MAG: hypothetical protein KJO91_05130 [Gammaproteobacteria bacterium]|nr:hypothetical protein [Gammaproteobacteria bacterium]
MLVTSVLHAEVLHHELSVQLYSENSSISVEDIITLPGNTDQVIFSLNNAFEASSQNATLEIISHSKNKRTNVYQLSRLPEDRKVHLKYRGKIIENSRSGLFGMPERLFDEKMLYLDGRSHWYPVFPAHPNLTFDLVSTLPEGWEIISQGKGNRSGKRIKFHMPRAQDDIYLIGAPWKRYAKSSGDIELEVFLLNENPALAKSYLDATEKYIELYSNWIGDYPYKKFAVVENSWQTGYGMPSFTLLGSNVIRLPFIIYTSLPHEILHNWWGNGVFIDFSKGNWSEGLTAYMADHFSSEQRHKDSEYRRKALERYANFAARQNDFALKNFTSRHNEASQAIGYSKSLMLFHMIRSRLGDEIFNSKIRAFWEAYQFSSASFPELLAALLDGTELDTNSFITQWLNRKGAPEIMLTETSVKKIDDTFTLSVHLKQLQNDDSYQLPVPMKVVFNNGKTIAEQLKLTDKSQQFNFRYKHQPVEIQIDPDYDIFRLLSPQEKPASLGRLFGAKTQLLVYPEASSKEVINAWFKLAALWNKKYNNIRLVPDSEFKLLSPDTAVWILGWNNKLLQNHRQRLNSDSQEMPSQSVRINKETFQTTDHALVLLDNDTGRSPLGFIGANNPSTINRLARKLPHYNSYGRLVFENRSASNIVKQHLKVSNSPLKSSL